MCQLSTSGIYAHTLSNRNYRNEACIRHVVFGNSYADDRQNTHLRGTILHAMLELIISHRVEIISGISM